MIYHMTLYLWLWLYSLSFS